MANQDIFSKWDETVDIEGLAADVKAAEENGTGSYKEVPHGDYEVAINKLELGESKKGDQMVSIWFKIVSDGEYKGSMIFMYQVITQGFQISIVNKILRAMTTECKGLDIEFKSYTQYRELLMDVFEAVDNKFEFALSYKKGKKDFSTYEITEVYALED